MGCMARFPASILTSSGILRLLRQGKYDSVFLSGREYLLLVNLVEGLEGEIEGKAFSRAMLLMTMVLV